MTKLAILFPGIGYTCDKPLLYYGRDLAEQADYECKLVSYVYDGDKKIRGNREKMQAAFQALYVQVEEYLASIDYGQYDEVLFMSKSVGTVIAAAYAKELMKQGNNVNIRHVLYTPLEYTFAYQPQNAIGFLGTADPWCVPSEVLRLAEEQHVPMFVYERANHSLETEDILSNLDVLKDVMKKTKDFLDE